MSGRRDSTCQKNVLPKSLQGTEDAEFVWNMITERFPNAAPLLCEMETVIDRAEDLLQQLRTPYVQEIETSTSFCTPESVESMISAQESVILENNSNVRLSKSLEDNAKVAETQISESDAYGDDDSNSQSRKSSSKDLDAGSRCSDSSSLQNSSDKFIGVEKSASSQAETHDVQEVKEVTSLEKWEKVVHSAMKESNAGRKISDKPSIKEESLDFNYSISTSADGQSRERPTGRNKGYKIDNNTVEDSQKSCIILHRQKKCADIGDSVVEVDSHHTVDTPGVIETKDDTTNIFFKGSGDENSSKLDGQRQPLDILEAYAKRCNATVTYSHVTDRPSRYKSNVYVIRGCLAGFTATCRGENEESAKNGVALKILQMMANQQMTDEKITTLSELSKDELLEVINLGMDSSRETAQRKLYQLCLETGEEVPKYRVEKEESYQGFTYVAVCTALGYISTGRGSRECGAKKIAAEKLYELYLENTRGEHT